MYKAFYGKYNEMFRACASQASPRGGGGGEGPGDKATDTCTKITGHNTLTS